MLRASIFTTQCNTQSDDVDDVETCIQLLFPRVKYILDVNTLSLIVNKLHILQQKSLKIIKFMNSCNLYFGSYRYKVENKEMLLVLLVLTKQINLMRFFTFFPQFNYETCNKFDLFHRMLLSSFFGRSTFIEMCAFASKWINFS